MEAVALPLANALPAVVGTGGAPPSENSGSDAFAGLLAQAMAGGEGQAVEPAMVASAGVPISTTVPTSLGASAEPAAPTTEAKVPPACPSPFEATQAPLSEPASIEEARVSPPCPSPIVSAGGRAGEASPGERIEGARAEAPPETPPPTQAISIRSEKEAPTTAPNAPVTPLDRTSEDETEIDKVDDAPASPNEILASSAASVVPASVQAVPLAPSKAVVEPKVSASASAKTKAPLDPSPRVEGEGSTPDATAKPTDRPRAKGKAAKEPTQEVASTSPKTDPIAPEVEAAAETFVPQAVRDDVPVATLPEAVAASEVPTVGHVPTAKPVAPTLPKAADLKIDPKVTVTSELAAPTVSASNPASPIANAKIERIAEASSKAPVAEAAPVSKVEPKAVEVEKADVPMTSLVQEAASTDSAPQEDDASQGDSPKDPTPQAASSAPAAKTAATERPDPGTARPSVDRHLVVRQVADRIENLAASRPRDGVVVHLEPRELGTVTLVVKGLSSALDVQMFASDDRVRQSLESSRPELAQALAPRGIEVRDLKVAAAPPAPSASSSTAANAGANPDGRPRQSAPQSGFASSSKGRDREAAPERTVRTNRNQGRVDLLV